MIPDKFSKLKKCYYNFNKFNFGIYCNGTIFSPTLGVEKTFNLINFNYYKIIFESKINIISFQSLVNLKKLNHFFNVSNVYGFIFKRIRVI